MAGAESTLAVQGLKELTRTFNNAPKDVKKAYREELKTVAEPVRLTAQRLAVSEIRRMAFSPRWAEMRTGVSVQRVYVAPKKRGIKRRGNRLHGRPNLAILLIDRVLDPALAQNAGRIEEDFDRMLDRLVTKWDHDGP